MFGPAGPLVAQTTYGVTSYKLSRIIKTFMNKCENQPRPYFKRATYEVITPLCENRVWPHETNTNNGLICTDGQETPRHNVYGHQSTIIYSFGFTLQPLIRIIIPN